MSMLSALHMGKSGMFAMERKLQIIISNVGNVETPGYKRQNLEMESLFPLLLKNSYAEYDQRNGKYNTKRKKYMEYGQGVRIVDVRRDTSEGILEVSDREMDVAIEGRGFFQFRLPSGEIGYSRAGNFHKDSEGNMLNASGHPLEPAIRIPKETRELIINRQGEVLAKYSDDTTPESIGQIVLATFENPDRLKGIGQNMGQPTDLSGEPVLETPGAGKSGDVNQRVLELSNVNVMEEMMEMLFSVRMFQTVVGAQSTSFAMLKEALVLSKG
jgi:flagellar basal-body rod protein FlgG